jgi:hypothetical protein
MERRGSRPRALGSLNNRVSLPPARPGQPAAGPGSERTPADSGWRQDPARLRPRGEELSPEDELRQAFGRAIGFTLAAIILLVGGGIVVFLIGGIFFGFLFGSNGSP